MTEEIKKILDVYIAQTGIINTLWNIFLAISLAILGYIYKDRTLMDDWKIKIGLTVGFSLFSLGNSSAIVRSQEILVSSVTFFQRVSNSVSSELSQFLKSHTAISVSSMRVSHVFFTTVILLAMWLPNIAKIFSNGRNKPSVPG